MSRKRDNTKRPYRKRPIPRLTQFPLNSSAYGELVQLKCMDLLLIQDLRDTVASVGVSIILPHIESNPAIKTFRHALALDEHLIKFEPVHYNHTDDVARRDAMQTTGTQKGDTCTSAREVWFLGSHSGALYLNSPRTSWCIEKLPSRCRRRIGKKWD